MNFDTMIWALEELADKDTQMKLWTGNTIGEMGSFDEAVCGVFDDSDLGRQLDKGEASSQLSPEIFAKAVELRRLIQLVPRLEAPLVMIETPEMQAIRTSAEGLLTLLRVTAAFQRP
jgi:hypothetical protein